MFKKSLPIITITCFLVLLVVVSFNLEVKALETTTQTKQILSKKTSEENLKNNLESNNVFKQNLEKEKPFVEKRLTLKDISEKISDTELQEIKRIFKDSEQKNIKLKDGKVVMGEKVLIEIVERDFHDLFYSSDGKYLMAYGGGSGVRITDKLVYFLRNDGTIIKKLNLGYAGSILGNCALKSNMCVILHENVNPDKIKKAEFGIDKVILQAFSFNGTELWKKEFEGKGIFELTNDKLTISANGNFIVFSLHEAPLHEVDGVLKANTYILDREEKILKIFDSPYYSKISLNETTLGLYHNEKSILIFNLLENRVEFDRTFPELEDSPVYVIKDITEDGNKILIAEPKLKRGCPHSCQYMDSLYILDKTKKTLSKGVFEKEFFGDIKMKYDSNNRISIIKSNIGKDEKTKILQIEE